MMFIIKSIQPKLSKDINEIIKQKSFYTNKFKILGNMSMDLKYWEVEEDSYDIEEK